MRSRKEDSSWYRFLISMSDTYGWRIVSRMRQHRNEVAKWICSSRKCATCTGNSDNSTDGELHSQFYLLCLVTYRKKFQAIRRINRLCWMISNFLYAYGVSGSSFPTTLGPYNISLSHQNISVRIWRKSWKCRGETCNVMRRIHYGKEAKNS